MTFNGHDRVCVVCNNSFHTMHNGQKICGRVCSLKIKAERKKDYYSINKGLINDRSKKSRLLNPIKFLLYSAKSRAKKDGLDFNLSEDDLFIPELCPVLGLKINTDGLRDGSSPSLDRTDNRLGYIKGNVEIISDRANRIKNDSNIDDIDKLLTYMNNKKYNVIELFIPVLPKPASRPRVTRYGTYHLKPYTDFRSEVNYFLQKWYKEGSYKKNLNKMDEFTLLLEVICKRPKKPSNSFPRPDIDNFLKGYMDCLTHSKLFYIDDNQVVKVEASKRYQEEGEPYGAFISIFKNKRYKNEEEDYGAQVSIREV